MARPKKLAAPPPQEKRKSGQPKNPVAAAAPNGSPAHTKLDRENKRASHLRCLKLWMAFEEEADVLAKKRRELVAHTKGKGHTVDEMKVAMALRGNAKDAAKVHARMYRDTFASFCNNEPNSAAQLDLFEQPDRTPGVDRAYQEGWDASAQGNAAKPHYDSSTPQYNQYMQGYHEHQKTIMAGFKPLEEGDEGELQPHQADDGWGDEDPSRPFN